LQSRKAELLEFAESAGIWRIRSSKVKELVKGIDIKRRTA
jgi:hypothetical protein